MRPVLAMPSDNGTRQEVAGADKSIYSVRMKRPARAWSANACAGELLRQLAAYALGHAAGSNASPDRFMRAAL